MTDPTRKDATPLPASLDAPFLCPHCSRPLNEVNTQVIGAMVIFSHGGQVDVGCRKVLNVQLMALPRPTQPLVKPAGNIIIRN